MKPYLLDTSVLIALAWPNHVHHGQAVDWFRAKGAAGFRSCPITQAGFVRISSHPSFGAHAASPVDALGLLKRITVMREHEFWPDDLPLTEAFEDRLLPATHRQLTDAYLLALAVRHGGILATLDRGIASLARRCPESLELISGI
jgi:hypothetical protein